MSERLRSLVYATFLIGAAVTLLVVVLATPTAEDRVEELGSRIRCPVCQGEAIIDSPAPMARDIMDLVRQRVEEGMSDQQILAEITSSYSGAVLLDPPARGQTLWLWLAPGFALIAGLVVIIWWRTHPPVDEVTTVAGPRPRSRARWIAGALLLSLGAGAVIVAAGSALQSDDASALGVATLDGVDPSQVSNETMEAVIAANLDHPRIAGMRLALAERYFQQGEFQAAFDHYLGVADSATASPDEVHTALARLGWMAYQGNGEVDTALALLDRALSIERTPMALYARGQVLWCGAGRPDEAAEMFHEVLDRGGLEGRSRDQITSEREAARRGEQCP